MGLYKLPCSFFLLFLCLLLAFWFDPSIVFLFDLWFVMHIGLLLGCLPHGCFHRLFLAHVWLKVLLCHASFSSLSMVRGHKVKPLWPMASPLRFYFLVLFWDCYYVGISSHGKCCPLHLDLIWVFLCTILLLWLCVLSLFWSRFLLRTFFFACDYVSDFFDLGSWALCILDMLFRLDCWFWGSVVQLVCVLCSSPISDHGFFFPLVCC